MITSSITFSTGLDLESFSHSLDENEITNCYSHVSRRDSDLRKSFLMVKQEKIKLILTRIPGMTSDLGWVGWIRWTVIISHKSTKSTFSANKKRSFNLRAPQQTFTILVETSRGREIYE